MLHKYVVEVDTRYDFKSHELKSINYKQIYQDLK
jgi:hypothetical protein